MASSTPALVHGHVRIVFHHQLSIGVHVEQRLRTLLGRYAARQRNQRRVVGVHQRLHDRVIGCVNVTGQRKRTLTVAVESIEPGRRPNPIVEPDLLEVHVHRIPLADLLFRLLMRPTRLDGRPFAASHHPFQRALLACTNIQ